MQSLGWYRASQLGVTAWEQYEPTLQTYGTGTYYISSLHDAYTPYCGGGWAEQFGGWTSTPPASTNNSINIARPTLSRGVVPYYLGSGITQSNDYSPQTTLTANGNGAPETPQWSFVAGSNFGNLSCTNCSSPVFTATAAGTACGAYNVVIQASFKGFISSPLFIDIQTPSRLSYYWTASLYPPQGGWESDVYYSNIDGCGNGMTNVQMNEVFNYWYPGPGGSGTNWPLPLTADGFSNMTYVSGSGWLLRDILYEVPPETPTPMTTGSNGYDESSTSWITYHEQHWRVGSAYNGGPGGVPSVSTGPTNGSDSAAQGIWVQINDDNHYLDHGAHHNQRHP